MNAAARDPGKWARQAWMNALQRTQFVQRNPEITLPGLIETSAARQAAAPALCSPESSLTYSELAVRIAQNARWGIAQGLSRGDAVCLFMPGCAEYVATWLGLTRIGAIVALINTHLSGDALAHAIRIARPKAMIVDASLAPALRGVRASLPAGMSFWIRGASDEDMAPFDSAHTETPTTDGDASRLPVPRADDTALYIYTSGTTGLPKAARVSHYRLMQWSHWFAGLMDIGDADRMYDCLPLYHSVGGVVAACATLVGGGAVIIRPRFSASDFWRDVRAERCTLFQYIGELCRYLVNAPEQPDERRHSLRLVCGNGLRREVWEAFQSRFRIPRILEYYAATEANFSLYNCEGEPGSIGRIPPYLGQDAGVALLRVDTDSGEPERGIDGFCRRCMVDEAGEAVSVIPQSSGPRGGRFEGYTDERATTGKVLRDVFATGDAWYRSGDLMRRDARGFFYFVDRVGETFRWKGENVSTAEVLAVLAALPHVLEGAVYGVRVPGTEGRAAMAALVVSAEFDLVGFREQVALRLPGYSQPLFLRLLPRLESTGTFKPIKRALELAGYDPGEVTDPLYFNSRGANGFVPLDAEIHAAIVAGTIRL